jgi:hypothetical protein
VAFIQVGLDAFGKKFVGSEVRALNGGSKPNGQHIGDQEMIAQV